MKITDLLELGGVIVKTHVSSQSELIDKLVAQLVARGAAQDATALAEAVREREEVFSTAIGDGLALPHAQSNTVTKLSVAAATVTGGVDWDAPDGLPADLVFLVAAPLSEQNAHLEIMAKVSALLTRADIVQTLRAASTPDEFVRIISEAEAQGASSTRNTLEATKQGEKRERPHLSFAERMAEASNRRKREASSPASTTAPAHMSQPAEVSSASALTPAATISGATKAKAAPKANEAEQAVDSDAQSQAAETPQAQSWIDPELKARLYGHLRQGIAPMLPFILAGGLLTTIAFALDGGGAGTSAFGFYAPYAAFFKKLGEEALSMMLPILSGFIAFSIADRPGLAPGIVGGLLVWNGYNLDYLNSAPNLDMSLSVSSGYLGAIFAGFVAGYLMQLIKRLCDLLPEQFEGIKPVLLYPLFGILGTGIAVFLLSPVVTWVHSLLQTYLMGMGGTNAVLLGSVLAAMMAIDLGGPFNSAAYAFGITILTAGVAGSRQAMASIMLGGMVPPLVIAIATTLMARHKFTKEEFKLGAINYILGISFVTEGVVPFAATDLPNVVTSCVLGSVVAGAISGAFGCATTATSGGLFALPVIDKPGPFIFALLFGAAIGALVLTFLRRPRERHMAS